MAAFKDTESFSAVNAIGGPFPPLPFEPEGDDISAQIEAHRHRFPIFEHMVVMDPPDHERARSLLSKLLTPRRLKENEEYMWRLVDRQIDEFIGNGRASSWRSTPNRSPRWPSPTYWVCPRKTATRFDMRWAPAGHLVTRWAR